MKDLAFNTRHLLRKAMIKFVTNDDRFNVAVTLQFNQFAVTPYRYEQLASRFGERLGEKLLHKRYKALKKNRIHGIYFVEHADTNTHLHGMLKLPDWRITDDALVDTQLKADRCWDKLIASGSVVLKKMYDAEGWASYITKEFGKQRFCERFFFTNDRDD